MAESDETGKSRALPPPELNPLLNPTLNKNLSRWAEVYFKSPPENRDEAVRELLRELENGNSQNAVAVSAPPSEEQDANETVRSGAQAFECPSCGFMTRPNQKFCGRCGARLVSPAQPVERKSEGNVAWGASPRNGDTHRSEEQRPSLIEPEPEVEEPWIGQQEEVAPLWYSYRFYIGAGFAMVVLVLAYLAWQGAKASPQPSKLPEQVPTATTSQNSATPEPPKATQTAPTTGSASPSTGAAQSPAAEKSESEPTTSQEKSSQPQPAASTAPESQAPANTDSTTSGGGAEELATARQFLNGTSPNNFLAAEWLWKSVAKQNTEATILLARLYLRGEGVQKNCEQGRILLDAAARKGRKDAAAMLQNLPAFGCE